MKRIIMNDTELSSSAGSFAFTLRYLKSGEMIELGNCNTTDGIEWIEVISDDKVIGYIKGNTPLLDPEKYCYITQEFVYVYENPDINSKVLRTYKRNDEIYLIEKINSTAKWYKIMDIQGNTGYIEGDTLLKSSEVNGQRMVLYQDYVNIYKIPDNTSDIVSQKLSGLQIELLKIVKDSRGNRWFHIYTHSGEGYIEGNTKMLTVAEHKEWLEDLKKEREENIDLSDDMGIENFLFRKGIIGGLILMIAGLVWLFAGLMIRVFYYYSLVLVVIGLIAILRHLILAKKDKNFFIVVFLLAFIAISSLLIIANI